MCRRSSDAQIVLERVELEDNHAELTGGAMYVLGGQVLRIADSTFTHNRALGPSTTMPRAGGAVVADSLSSVSISDSRFCNH